jgi:hypothetical protein
MNKRYPSMYSYYSHEVNKALDLEDHERVGYLIQDMPYDILVALRKEGILPPRPDSDGLESVDNSRERTMIVEQEWTVTYTRVKEVLIDRTGSEYEDVNSAIRLTEEVTFPTEIGDVLICDIKEDQNVYPKENLEDREYDAVEKTMAKLQPLRTRTNIKWKDIK